MYSWKRLCGYPSFPGGSNLRLSRFEFFRSFHHTLKRAFPPLGPARRVFSPLFIGAFVIIITPSCPS